MPRSRFCSLNGCVSYFYICGNLILSHLTEFIDEITFQFISTHLYLLCFLMFFSPWISSFPNNIIFKLLVKFVQVCKFPFSAMRTTQSNSVTRYLKLAAVRSFYSLFQRIVAHVQGLGYNFEPSTKHVTFITIRLNDGEAVKCHRNVKNLLVNNLISQFLFYFSHNVYSCCIIFRLSS